MNISVLFRNYIIGCSLILHEVSSQRIHGRRTMGKSYKQVTSPPVGPPAVPPANCPIETGVKCKVCNEQNSASSADCQTRVVVRCTYLKGGVERSCFPQNNDDDEPSFKIRQSQCDRSNQVEVRATITYEVCNYNNYVFTPNPDVNHIKYGDRFPLDGSSSTDLNVPGWDNPIDKYHHHSQTTPTSYCRSETETRFFRPCDSDIRGMAIKFDGQLQGAFPNYCTCSMTAFVKSEVINNVQDENKVTSEPSISISISPSMSPLSPPRDNALLARMTSVTTDDYPNISGLIHVDREEKVVDGNNNRRRRLIINYDIHNGPTMCNDCFVGIYSGRSCHDLYLDSPFYDPDETSNPWTLNGNGGSYGDGYGGDGGDGARIVTNMRGDAAAYIAVFNGRGLKSHSCKYIAFHDSDGTVISCGVLIPVEEEDDFCN